MGRAHRNVLVLAAQFALASRTGGVAWVTVARIMPGVGQWVAGLAVTSTIVIVTGGDGGKALRPALMAEPEVLRHVVSLQRVLRGHRLVVHLETGTAAGSVDVERGHRRVVVRAVRGPLCLRRGDRLQRLVLVACVARC